MSSYTLENGVSHLVSREKGDPHLVARYTEVSQLRCGVSRCIGPLRFTILAVENVQRPGNHPTFEITLRVERPLLGRRSEFWEWKGHSRSNARNSGIFLEQLLNLHSRPKPWEN